MTSAKSVSVMLSSQGVTAASTSITYEVATAAPIEVPMALAQSVDDSAEVAGQSIAAANVLAPPVAPPPATRRPKPGLPVPPPVVSR